jgi:hypothetical protein
VKKKEEINIANTLKKKNGKIGICFDVMPEGKNLNPFYGVSQSLQRENTNLHNASKNLQDATFIIQNLRNEYNDLLVTSHDMCDKLGISKDYHEVRSKFAIKHFDEICGDRRFNVAAENFRVRVFFTTNRYSYFSTFK